MYNHNHKRSTNSLLKLGSFKHYMNVYNESLKVVGKKQPSCLSLIQLLPGRLFGVKILLQMSPSGTEEFIQPPWVSWSTSLTCM